MWEGNFEERWQLPPGAPCAAKGISIPYIESQPHAKPRKPHVVQSSIIPFTTSHHINHHPNPIIASLSRDKLTKPREKLTSCHLPSSHSQHPINQTSSDPIDNNLHGRYAFLGSKTTCHVKETESRRMPRRCNHSPCWTLLEQGRQPNGTRPTAESVFSSAISTNLLALATTVYSGASFERRISEIQKQEPKRLATG